MTKYSMHSNPVFKKRLMFHINLNSNTCVITEDIISAIKIHKATSFDAIAVLTNSIGDDIIITLKKYQKVFVWLDYDIRVSAIKQTSRLKSLGINVTSIITKLDPKGYNDNDLRAYLFAFE